MADEAARPSIANGEQPSSAINSSGSPIEKLRDHQQLSKSDLAFLLENNEMTEEILGDLLDNLKRTMENYKSTAHQMVKPLQNSMLVKRR